MICPFLHLALILSLSLPSSYVCSSFLFSLFQCLFFPRPFVFSRSAHDEAVKWRHWTTLGLKFKNITLLIQVLTSSIISFRFKQRLQLYFFCRTIFTETYVYDSQLKWHTFKIDVMLILGKYVNIHLAGLNYLFITPKSNINHQVTSDSTFILTTWLFLK